MSRSKFSINWRILAIVYAVLVVTVSSLPDVDLPDLGTGHLDKILHLVQYAVFGFLAARGWGPQRAGKGNGWATWLPAIVLLLFAMADEFHQKWIPGRDAEVNDWIADALGVAIGYLAGTMMNRHAHATTDANPSDAPDR